MKRSIYIVTILLIIGLSGCIGTKIYLGGDKREIADDTPIGRAIDPTSIPAGGTWGSIRTILNTNLSNINGTLDSVEVTLGDYGDSITAHRTAINLRLLKSDTASMLGNYTRNGELNSALAAKVNVSDTAAMLSPYALTSELGDIGTVLSTDDFDAGFVTLWAGPDSIRGTPNLTFTNDNTLTVSGNVYLGGISTYFGTTSATGSLKSRAAGGPALINREASETTPVFSVNQSYSTSGIGGTQGTAVGFIINGSSRFMSYATYNDSKVSLYTPAATSSFAGFRLPHGTAPSSPINGDLWTTTGGLFVHVNSSTDTLATQEYARQYGGTGTVTVSDVQDEIADSLNVLRAAVTVGNGTKAPYFDGSQDGGQILYFYGDNGFYTALQGGAPVANRSYRLPIAALPSAGTTSLMNIDEYGNMGFVASTTYAPTANPTFTGVQKVSTTDTLATKAYARSVGGGDIAILETRVDSIVDVLADTANLETVLQIDLDTDTLADLSEVRLRLAIADTSAMLTSYITRGDTASMLANYALLSEISEVSIDSLNLNGGSLTLTGDDKLTFETNGIASYSLPAGGGNLMIQSATQDMISDSLDVIRDMIMDSLLLRSEGIFVFGAGGGNPGDTVTFTGSGFPVLGSFNTGRDTLMITQVIGQLWDINTTDTLAVQIMYADSLNQTSFTTVWSSAIGINSDGLNSTSFASPKIPPRKWVWSRVASVVVGRKPTMINMELFGYKIKAY